MSFDSSATACRALPVRSMLVLLFAAAIAGSSVAQARPRGRDLGIPFPGQAGPLNAITDVGGSPSAT
jgi:D-aminopeptidase